MRRLAICLLAGLAPTAAATQHFPPDSDLELMVRYLVEDGEAPAVALGVLDPDGSTRAVAAGAFERGGAPVGPGSPFDLGTLTVTFTATLLAEMAGRGEVSVGDPIRRYLPGHVSLPRLGDYEITLDDLATHRAGLPAGPPGPYDGMTADDLYELVAAAELTRPGRRYEFSVLGYALLGHALARAAGMPFEDLLRQRVLAPLGMNATGYTPARVPEIMYGATGLRSSADDLLRFLSANVSPPASPLGEAMLTAREIRVERGHHDEDLGYGFSWRTQSVAGRPPIVTHGGRSAGSVTMMSFDPARGIGTVVLASDRTFNDRIGRRLLFFGPPPAEPEARVDPGVLRGYQGTYRSNVGLYRANLRQGRHFIRLEDHGHLTYQPNGRARVRLYARSDSAFYMLRLPVTVTFSRDGDAVRMAFRVDEREEGSGGFTAWRVRDATPPPAVVAGNAPFWRAWGPLTWTLAGLAVALAVVTVVMLLLL